MGKVFGPVVGPGAALRALFGVGMGLFDPDGRDSAVQRLLTAVIGGVVFGLGMGWGTQRQWAARRQRTAAFTAGLTDECRRLAVRASRRGPVPDDLGIRIAAAGLARDRLDELTAHRNAALIIFGGAAIVAAVLTVTWSPWWWLFVLLLVVTVATQLLQPRMLRYRLVLMQRLDVLGG